LAEEGKLYWGGNPYIGAGSRAGTLLTVQRNLIAVVDDDGGMLESIGRLLDAHGVSAGEKIPQ
jgi:hypothetical protein